MKSSFGVVMIVLALVCFSHLYHCDKDYLRIVDGDTFVISGEKFRIEGIDTPEIHGKCLFEEIVAEQAKVRLTKLLSRRAVHVMRTGKDKYGRTLARVEVDHKDIGDVLMKEGLARKWTKTWDGNEAPWCK